MRRHGLLVHELEQDQQTQQKRRLSRLKDRTRARAESKNTAAEPLLNRDASGLAADYADLAREIFTAIAALEEQKTAVAR